MVFNVILHFFLLQIVPGQIHLNTVQYQDLLTASEKATWLSGLLILTSDTHKKKKSLQKTDNSCASVRGETTAGDCWQLCEASVVGAGPL